MLETFYATTAQVSFTLLGLWWVVVQFKFDAWIDDPPRRRTARHVSLYFLLPGIMSLFAILASRLTALWRIGFGISAVLGLIEAVLALQRRGDMVRSRRITTALTALVYLLVAIVALAPTSASGLPGDPKGIEIEGILVTILLFIGTGFAWVMFVERPPARTG